MYVAQNIELREKNEWGVGRREGKVVCNRVRQNCPKCTEFIIPGWILYQWPCGVPEHFSESTVDLWKWRLTFFWPPLVKYKVKICPNWNFVINLIWNVLCSFGEHFKAAF